MQWPDDLIVVNATGMPVNQYRVSDGNLQFRIIYQQGPGAWRTLSVEDVLMHLSLKTDIAQWLYARRGFTGGPGLNKAA